MSDRSRSEKAANNSMKHEVEECGCLLVTLPIAHRWWWKCWPYHGCQARGRSVEFCTLYPQTTVRMLRHFLLDPEGWGLVHSAISRAERLANPCYVYSDGIAKIDLQWFGMFRTRHGSNKPVIHSSWSEWIYLRRMRSDAIRSVLTWTSMWSNTQRGYYIPAGNQILYP